LEFIQQNIYLVAIAVFSGAMLLITTFRNAGGPNALSPIEATLLINRENAEVIDVREPAEYAAGHIGDSRNIPLGTLIERAGEIAKLKDSAVILLCHSGVRSAGACSKLAKAGFTNVHSLEGGIDAWVQAGFPIRKGTKK
jgi:rhodanese-related sulfurtransferase